MAKKNGGLFGGLFDFNGDGKTDLGEEFIAYKIFEGCMKGNDDTDDDFSLDDDLDLDLIPSKDYSWRSYCEDGSEFCVFPEDYETEEEYEQALEEAKADGGGTTLSLSVEYPALDKLEAIKDNFKLPISLPDEDETREFEFYQAICKIAKKDVPLSFEV